MNLDNRDDWIRKRYKQLRKDNPESYDKELFVKISDELNTKYPLLWISWKTIRQICKNYGYYGGQNKK